MSYIRFRKAHRTQNDVDFRFFLENFECVCVCMCKRDGELFILMFRVDLCLSSFGLIIFRYFTRQ